MNKKSILIVAGVFYPEPIVSANLLTQLATKLGEKYKVTVLRPHPTRPMGFDMSECDYSHFPFNVIEIDSYTCAASSLVGRFCESYSMGKVSSTYIKEHHDEIDFVFNDSWHLIGLNIVARTCVKYKIPYITPIQDIYPESLFSKFPDITFLKWVLKSILSPIDKYTLFHAARIRTISEKMVEYLSTTRNIARDKFIVVRNWQNEDSFIEYSQNRCPCSTSDSNLFTFMYLGNVGPLAGIEVLFDALKIAKLPNVRLVVAGSGSAKKSLQEKAREYANCNIEFWDVPAGMVPIIQDKADVMCLPMKRGSAMFSIPSKLPAYMFSAKPILSSVDKDSDTAVCIKDAKAGWVAIPGDAKDVARCMKKATMLSRDQLLEMGKCGFEYSMRVFSKKVNPPILVKACEDIVEKNKF